MSKFQGDQVSKERLKTMIKIAIVGPEESKWKPNQKEDAKQWIEDFLSGMKLETEQGSLGGHDIILVSGHCPKKGVDIWAEEVADNLGIKKEIYPADCTLDPVNKCLGREYFHWWNFHYKPRNIQIAEACNVLYCIVPKDKTKICRHCWKEASTVLISEHPTNGGCWTAKYAKKLGKEVHLVVIE